MLYTYIMKIFKYISIATMFLFLNAYLGGSFSEASFNISQWDTTVRNMYAGIATFLSVIASLGISMHLSEQNK